jgi:threonine/homoserine/homoserine lactone efflux protein
MDPLWLFALLVFGIIAMPGMDMAFVLSSALADGRKGGFAAVAGIVAGGMAHVVMGTLGVGLVLQALPAAFNLLLTAGALYVGWIGWSLWRHPASLGAVESGGSRTAAQAFRRALATCLLNPKAYVFMVAVFPQFVRPDQGSLTAQAVVLGAIIVATQVLVYGAVALGADGLRIRLLHSAERQKTLARGVALLLAGTAAWALLHGWQAQRLQLPHPLTSEAASQPASGR